MQAPENLSREELAASVRRIGRAVVAGREVQGSRTAFAAAFVRAFHSTNEREKVFDDPVARRLLTGEEYALLEEVYFRRATKTSARGRAPAGAR